MNYLFSIIKLHFRALKYKYRNDKAEIKYLLSKLKKGATVLDIGAHKGAYLYFMSKAVGPKGTVIGFEPQTALYRALNSIVKYLGKQVRIEHLALSDEETELTLYVPSHGKKNNKTSPGASLIKMKSENQIASQEIVSVVPLDDYCNKHSLKPDFIKIDVEGNELAALRGGENILKKYKPVLLIEIEARHVGKERFYSTFDYLEELGYSPFFYKGNEKLSFEDFKLESDQNKADGSYINNFIFEPKTSE